MINLLLNVFEIFIMGMKPSTSECVCQWPRTSWWKFCEIASSDADVWLLALSVSCVMFLFSYHELRGKKLVCLPCNLVHSQGFSCYRSILKHQLNRIKLLSLKRTGQISMPGLIPQLWISSYSSWPRFTKEHGMGRFCDYYNQNLYITML